MKTLKDFALIEHGKYDHELSNLYLTFVAPKKAGDSSKYKYTVTIRVPRQDVGGKTQFVTKTRTSKAVSKVKELGEFLVDVRALRDTLFQDEYGVEFNSDALELLKKNRKPRGVKGTGQLGLRTSKSEYHFKVLYIEDGKDRYRNFPLVKYGSENAAYVEALKFNDRMLGNPVKSAAEYLETKTKVFFPDFGTSDYEYKLRRLREIKELIKIPKQGIEISADLRMIGFFANYFTELDTAGMKGQRRKSFNAKTLGEDESFIATCRAKDEIEGNDLLSDEEYLSLKPKGLFKGLL